MKKQKPAFSADEIRQRILEFLYSKRKKARSLASIAATITDVKRGLRPIGISQNEVITNLDFLVQHRWVLEEVQKRTYRSPKGFELPSEKRTYKLSDLGINHFEGSSPFSTTGRFAGINVHNIGGVTILGDNNVVRAEFMDVFRQLERLEDAMKMSSDVTEERKLNAKADIETIKDQLVKPVPDRNIIRTALEGVSFLGSIPGIMEFFRIVHDGIAPLLK